MLLLVSIIGTTRAQVETHYYDKGKSDVSIKRSARRDLKVNRMPSFDLASLLKEDAKKDTMGGFFRFGKGFDVGYTLADGQWENVEGGRLWTMTFASKDALSLNFVFNDFYLPNGAELYIENEDKTVVYGPVTKEATTENGVFLTDIIPSDQATITLFEPFGCEGQSSLTIRRVVHGYRGIQTSSTTKNATSNTRSVTHYEVACYPEYEKEADGVGLILSSNGTSLGCGALMMSTDFSFKPYFLTSYDLVDQNEDGIITDEERSAAENCAFKFRYKLIECNGYETTVSYTYNQDYVRAAWMGSRFTLLELRSNLKENLNLTWLGWNCVGISPTSATCLYYPSNSTESVLFDYNVVGYSNQSPILGQYGWMAHFDQGTPEHTTPGAPLLDQYNRVVGHIYYAVVFPEPFNPSSYIAGKLSWSFFGNDTESTGLRHWLDPNLTGWVVMDSYRPMIIKGANKIVSSANYYVYNLSSDLTVTWSISDSYYNENCLHQYNNTNSCTITRSSTHELSAATLTAKIKRNGSTVCTLTRIIYTGDGFDGTYYNGQATVAVDLPSPLYVLPGTLVTITSPNLVGATATQIGGNITPTSWSFDSVNGILEVGMPSTTGCAAVVSVVDTTGTTYVLPITAQNSVQMLSVSQEDNLLEISIAQQDRMNVSELERQKWTLETYNASSGRKVYSAIVEGSKSTIDTSDWKPGVYIVKASNGNQELSEKIVVK